MPAMMTEKLVTVAKPATRYFGIRRSLMIFFSTSFSATALITSLAMR